jgi:hypothetical protein
VVSRDSWEGEKQATKRLEGLILSLDAHGRGQKAHTLLYVLHSNRKSGPYEPELVFMKQMWTDASQHLFFLMTHCAININRQQRSLYEFGRLEVFVNFYCVCLK